MTTDNHDQALEARAFKLLADTLEADGYESVAMMLRAGRRVDLCERHVILAIIAALREGQKAGGQEAGRIESHFGWWVVCHGENGEFGQFVRDGSFVDRLKAAGVVVCATPLIAAAGAAGGE